MSKSIHEIIKENIIKELDAINITSGNLTKTLIEAREEFDSILDSILEELAKKEEEIKPEYGVTYWVVNSFGYAYPREWNDDRFDNIALKNNAIFKTQEEAEFEAERLKVLRELEKMGRAFKPYEDNYSVSLGYNLQNQENLGISCTGATEFLYGNYYFDSTEEAEKAIEKIGEERINKYLFRIDEE